MPGMWPLLEHTGPEQRQNAIPFIVLKIFKWIKSAHILPVEQDGVTNVMVAKAVMEALKC